MLIAIILHTPAFKSRGLSNESIKRPAASNNSLALALNHINTKLRVKFDSYSLTLFSMDFLGACVARGGGKIIPFLKLVRIVLETRNMVRKYANIRSFRKYIFSTKASLILLMSGFF